MNFTEVEKAKALTMIDVIEYVPKSVIVKTIFKKIAGNITVSSYDIGEESTENKILFDTYIQIIDGKAEIIIDGTSNVLETGQSIIIPAHTSNMVKANERFKMISTIIKNGNE